MAIKAGDQQFGSRYLELVGNSVTLAAVTTLLAVGLAALMAYGRRLQGSPAVQLANRLAAMGYAIPGTIIAVGVLVPFAAFDNALDAWLRTHAGVSRSEEHTSELQSLMRISYAVFCLKKKNNT